MREVHVLVLEGFRGLRPGPGIEARHLDGDGTNNRLINLRWGTYQEQWLDKKRHGRTCEGEQSPNAKLTTQQVLEIRSLWASRELNQREIADRYGVSRKYVGEIVNRKHWRHV